MREIGHAAGVAPFIVIPGDDLDEVVAQRHGREAVDDGGMRIPAKVGGDQQLLGIREDALEPPSRGSRCSSAYSPPVCCRASDSGYTSARLSIPAAAASPLSLACPLEKVFELE